MISFSMSLSYNAIAKSKKLLHIGANTGQEAKLYHDLGVKCWHVEAVPDLFYKMKDNISCFPDQIPINCCLSSHEGEVVTFNIANNGGQSSSMFELGRHSSAYPLVQYTDAISLTTSTVDRLIEQEVIDPDLDFLLIDAQGAELKILQGATSLLDSNSLQFALIEVAIEPIYEGGASFIDILNILYQHHLYLREAQFNELGWTNALFQRAYWPTKPPTAYFETARTNLATSAHLISSSECVVPTPSAFSGKPTGSFSFHTQKEFQPWCKLCFDDALDIEQIIVYNRCEAATERAYELNIYYSVNDNDWSLLHENNEPFGGVDWPGPLSVEAKIRAKYLLFRLRNQDFFHLDQIMVY